MKQDFTDNDISILEDEFNFSLSGSEKVDYVRYYMSWDVTEAQVWIINVKESKKFIKNNLHLSYEDFYESKFEPYSKSDKGKHFYNSTDNHREYNSFIVGLEYVSDLADYIVQIYKLPYKKTYTVTIYKDSNFKSKDIWDKF